MDKKGSAATRAKNKYNGANYDRLYPYVKKGKKAEYEKAAEDADYDSLNEFIIDAIEEKISRLENCISDCILEDGISLTILDNLLYMAYRDKHPSDPYERETHYMERISKGYAVIKKEIARYFTDN